MTRRRITNSPFRVSLPFTDEVTRTDAEERAVGLGCHCFRKVTLSSARRSVKENTLPGCSLAGKQMRELDRQDDGLFQRGLCALKSSDVAPLYVGFLG